MFDLISWEQIATIATALTSFLGAALAFESKWATGNRKWGWIFLFALLGIAGVVADERIRLSNKKEEESRAEAQRESFMAILRSTTGGDSYAFIDLANRPPIDNAQPIIAEITGRLMGVIIEIKKDEDDKFGRAHGIPPNLTPDKVALSEALAPGSYTINFLSLNGPWQQRLTILAEDGKFRRLPTKITKDGKEIVR